VTTAIQPHEAARRLIERRQARADLLAFAQFTMPGYDPAPHLHLLAQRLHAIEQGDLKRLMVFFPPRHGKTEMVSIRFPCWYLGRHPRAKVVQAGYAESITLVHSRAARQVFLSPEMGRLFPALRGGASTVREAAHEWETAAGGSYYGVGVGGGLTGRGFNIGIIDDPVKDAEEARSPTVRQHIWDWYTQVFRTRAEPEGSIILIMTRWHDDDLAGRLLKQSHDDPEADQWEVLHLKAIDHEGNALWPARYPIEVLKQTRATIGSSQFAALYQGSPQIETGNIVKRDWWKFYDPDERPAFNRIVHSWDTAFKTKSANDWSVGTVWGQNETGVYLLDVWRARVEFPELKRAAVSLWERDRAIAVLVEDAASGQSLTQELRRETPIPVIPVKVDSDKVSRLYAVTPMIEAGRVFLPRRAPWLHDYLEELSAFPSGAYDDQVDSTTQALRYMMSAGTPNIRWL